VKNIINEILIFLIETLFFFKKIVLFIFNIIRKIVVAFFSFLFFKIIVKLYYQYILIYKKIKEINRIHNSRLYLIKKNSSIVLIVILVLVLIFNGIRKTEAQGFSDQIHKTTLAQTIESDFAELEQDELIIETIGDENLETMRVDRYLNSDGVIEPKIRDINEGHENGAMLSSEQGDTLSKPGLAAIEIDSKTRNEVIEYTVEAGDTVTSIARKFKLNVNTILWENDLNARSLISPGGKLRILPSDGIIHSVARNETLGEISSDYSVSSDSIITSNRLNPDETLKVGQKLFIPGGKKIVSPTTVSSRTYSGTTITQAPSHNVSQTTTYTGGRLLWPTVGNRITQYYSWRHKGLDVANRTGTPLYAAESGTVERSGWSTGYGYNVVISHGGGLKTLYGHASVLRVRAGDWVNRGDIIADMGSTGWSTGPHIHFEVILNGVKQNPLNYLR
jgi:LysM repeat protein